MENGLSIQVFDQIPASPRHQLKWRKCEITNALHVTIMNLKIEMVKEKHPAEEDDSFIFEGWVRTPMTNWQYIGGGFKSLDELKQNALLNVSKQLRALANHVASLANFEQI